MLKYYALYLWYHSFLLIALLDISCITSLSSASYISHIWLDQADWSDLLAALLSLVTTSCSSDPCLRPGEAMFPGSCQRHLAAGGGCWLSSWTCLSPHSLTRGHAISCRLWKAPALPWRTSRGERSRPLRRRGRPGNTIYKPHSIWDRGCSVVSPSLPDHCSPVNIYFEGL